MAREAFYYQESDKRAIDKIFDGLRKVGIVKTYGYWGVYPDGAPETPENLTGKVYDFEAPSRIFAEALGKASDAKGSGNMFRFFGRFSERV